MSAYRSLHCGHRPESPLVLDLHIDARSNRRQISIRPDRAWWRTATNHQAQEHLDSQTAYRALAKTLAVLPPLRLLQRPESHADAQCSTENFGTQSEVNLRAFAPAARRRSGPARNAGIHNRRIRQV